MLNAPGVPAAGIRRAPDSDCRRPDSGGQMHRSGIISNVKTRSANQLGEFRNRQAQQQNRLVEIVCHVAGERLLARTGCNDDRESLCSESAGYFAELAGLPPLCLHEGSRMNNNVWTAFQFFLHTSGLSGMYFVSKARRSMPPHAEPMKQSHGRFHSMDHWVRRRHAAVIQVCPSVMFGTDTFSPGHTRIHQAGWSTVEIDNGLKTPREQSQSR